LKRKKSYLISQKNIFWEKAIGTTICLLVVLVPLVFYPWCITVFLPAKELLFKLLIVIALMFWGLKITSEKKLSFNHSPLNVPILSFISLSLLSLFWSNSFLLSVTELPLFLAGPFLYFIIINNINNEKQINTILNTVIILGSLFGIYGILQYQGIDFSFWGHNVGRQAVAGLFGNVNYFAEYLIAVLPLAVSLFFITSIKSNKSKKILLLIGILTMGGSLLLTFTRGSYCFYFLLFAGGRCLLEKIERFLFLSLLLLFLLFLYLLFQIP